MKSELPALPACASQDASDGACGLVALEARLTQDLAWLELPSKRWGIPRLHEGAPVLEVAVIGAGMAGLAALAVLKHLGIDARAFDRAPEGFEGPWATTARMETLRSPKHLTGPALGLPALTFRAWYEAQFGTAAWAGLDKIPRLMWMDYLRWYRKVLALDVQSGCEVRRITPRADGMVSLLMRGRLGEHEVMARRVVLASGRDGLGGMAVPEFAKALPKTRWAHSSDPLDHANLRDLRVGVVGAGASAMDSAASALEAGAARADLFIRRTDLPRINKSKGALNPGLTHGHFMLPDEWKWRLRHYINQQQVPPPRNSTLRVSRHPNARFHLGSAVQGAREENGALVLTTARGAFELDFLIFATGFKVDFAARPELAAIAPHIRFWRDRFAPPDGQPDTELEDSPDLGPAFEFQSKGRAVCPGLSSIHCFCWPATLSHGAISGDIPSISEGAERLGQGIAALLYREDVAAHFAALEAYAEPELLGDEWTRWPGPDD
ncbi:MAG: NAD(P)/FAD-dependent oxidoreductase [Burkholderiales bacterium]